MVSLLIALSAAIIVFQRHGSSLSSPSLSDGRAEPARTIQSPFQNVQPEVAYVGDAACVECHGDIAKHYSSHPMGRSAAPTNPALLREVSGSGGVRFEHDGWVYRVFERDHKVWHSVERTDAKGQSVAVAKFEAAYEIGSGTRGKTYLVEREGRLFQSPISWYSERRVWDLSPGYNTELNFNRVIGTHCLFCHTNQTEHIEGTLNSYRRPIFRGLTIGCERCHGPGELHVRLRESGERVASPDYSIVNPRHLEPPLAEAVCQQCHLQGERRVVPRGRSMTDFRPGLPLEWFVTHFMHKPELRANFRSVGQVEQMHLSRCFQGSSGQLQCTSCHDPHRRPEASERTSWYRQACLKCHDNRGCRLAESERRVRSAADSCIDCHMSKDGSSNIPHTAVTDHRILRVPERSNPPPARRLQPHEIPLVPFGWSGGELSESQRRDLGVVLAEISENQQEAGPTLARLAMPLLDAALKNHADDLVAWHAKGLALRQIGLTAESLQAFEQVLAYEPRNERTLLQAAEAATALGRLDQAINFWKRAIDINPVMPGYFLSLARLHAQKREWSLALSASDQAVRLEPINVDARMLRVTAMVRLGQLEQAEIEFNTILSMRPKNEADLRRAYNALQR
jgi:predicted CXXCH cytochrome family protein